MKRILLFSGFLLAYVHAYSQAIFDTEIRPRSEFRNGYKKTQISDGDIPEFVITQRSVLGLSYESTGISSRFSLQDVRTWGESPVKNDNATLHIKEMWLEFPLMDFFHLKVGRQILKYDDQRILAATNWNNVGTQHDILLLKLKNKDLKAHLGVAYNNETGKEDFESYYPVPLYKAMSFLWINHSLASNLNISLLGVADWNSIPNTSDHYYRRFTYGGTLKYKNHDKWRASTTFYLQEGENKAGVPVEAYLYALRVHYRFTKGSSVYGGIDIYSGNDPNASSGKTRRFDRLYGAKHKYFGVMDYFPSGNTGIRDIIGGTTIGAGPRGNIDLSLHLLSLPHDYTESISGNKIDRYLGTEVDLKFDYKISEELKLGLQHGVMFGTSSMDVIKGGDHNRFNNFGTVFITYKPKFEL